MRGAQGGVAELGTEDLRLSAAESAELLDVEGAVTGTAWTPDNAARLHTRTEGWVIGVHLGVRGDDACRADPRLAVARALTGAHTGRPQEIVSWTAVAERVLDAPAGGPRPTPAEVTAARIEIAMMRWTSAIFDGDARASRQHLDEILRLLPDGAATSSGFVVLAQGVSKFRAGELDAAWVTLSEAESAGEERGELVAVVAARGPCWPPWTDDLRKRPCSRQRRGGRSRRRARRAFQHRDLPRRPGLGRAAGGQAAAGQSSASGGRSSW